MSEHPEQQGFSEQHLHKELEQLNSEWRSLIEEQEAILARGNEPEDLMRLEQIHAHLQKILDQQWEIQQALFQQWPKQE